MEKHEAEGMVKQAHKIAQEIGCIDLDSKIMLGNGDTALCDYKDVGITINDMDMLEGVKSKKIRLDITLEVLKLIRNRLLEEAKELLCSKCFHKAIVGKG